MTLHDSRLAMMSDDTRNNWTNLVVKTEIPQPNKPDAEYNIINHPSDLNDLSPEPAYYYYEPCPSPPQTTVNTNTDNDNFWTVYKDLCAPKHPHDQQQQQPVEAPNSLFEDNTPTVTPSSLSQDCFVSEAGFTTKIASLKLPTVSYTDKTSPVHPKLVKNTLPLSSSEPYNFNSYETQEMENTHCPQQCVDQFNQNPIINKLQSELQEDYSNNAIPFTLLETPKEQLPLTVRQRMLQLRFMTVKTKHRNKAASLQNFYHIQAANIEGERNRQLTLRQDSGDETGLNFYYDYQHHSLINRIEQSVNVLEEYSPTVVNNREQDKAPLKFDIDIVRQRKRITPRDGNNRFVSTYNPVAVRIMSNWYDRNVNHPYPSNDTCEIFAKAGNITIEQVKKWFANRRMRERNTKSLGQIAKERKIRKRSISDETITTKRHCIL